MRLVVVGCSPLGVCAALRSGAAAVATWSAVALVGCGAPVARPNAPPPPPASSSPVRTSTAPTSDAPSPPREPQPTPRTTAPDAAASGSAVETEAPAGVLGPDQVPVVTGTTSRFAAGTPDATLRAAFACAAADDFACYAALNVRSNRDSDMALAHLKNYQWRLFRERWQGYVVRKEPFSLHITRRVTEPGRTPRIKLFLFSDGRDNPAPCIFELQDGVWRIYANSL